MTIERILVIGAGTMGRQIAMCCALGGYSTVLQDISADALDAARAELESWAAGRVAKGKLDQSTADAALGRLGQDTDLVQGASTADLVIEAAVERLDIKEQIFAQLGEHAPAHAILATNSSTLPSSKYSTASSKRMRIRVEKSA